MNSVLRDTLERMELGGRFGNHATQFYIKEIPGEGWWIFDGEVQVGLVLRERGEAELVNHDPLAPRAVVEFPEIYHAPTQPGDRITLVAWVTVAAGVKRERYDLRLEVGDEGVTVFTEESWSDGRSAQCLSLIHISEPTRPY